MPGRRYPRRSQPETQSSHVRSVFRGGLDGASNIPYPVGIRRDQFGSGGECPEVLFFHEEFPATGGGQSIMLKWLPIPHSEHVYLVRGDAGTYQRQETAWTRDGGSTTVRVQSMMDARAGDVIVVEYAYYMSTPFIAVPLWPGVRYGPWVDGPITFGRLLQPKIHTGFSGETNGVPNPTYLALGDGTVSSRSYSSDLVYTETEKNAANNSDLQYAKSETAYIMPGYFSYSGQVWVSDACIHHPVRDGIPHYEPYGEMVSDSKAVGWDFGSVQYFDQTRCNTNGLESLYETWRLSPTGYNAYQIYKEVTPAGPIIPGTGYMDVWYRRTFLLSNAGGQFPSPYGYTMLVGTAGGYAIKSATYKPTIYKDRIFPASGVTAVSPSVQITPTGPVFGSSPYSGQKFTVPILPEAKEIPEWGSIRAPAYRPVEAPGTNIPTESDAVAVGPPGADYVMQGCLDFKCYGEAQQPQYRLIYAKT